MKSQPTAPQFPVMPLTLTLMWFSLDRLAWGTGWVMWHYKCLFIKLSPQVILLGSCVFVHYFSLCFFFPFPPRSHQIAHFSETRHKCHYFCCIFMSPCCVNRKKHLLTLLVAVQKSASCGATALADLQPRLPLIQNPSWKHFRLYSAQDLISSPSRRIRMKAALSSLYNNGWTVVNIGAAQSRYV